MSARVALRWCAPGAIAVACATAGYWSRALATIGFLLGGMMVPTGAWRAFQ